MKRSKWMTYGGFATGLMAERRESARQARLSFRIRRLIAWLLAPIGDVLNRVFDRVDSMYLVLLLLGLLSTAIVVALTTWIGVPFGALVTGCVVTTIGMVFAHWIYERSMPAPTAAQLRSFIELEEARSRGDSARRLAV